MGWAIAAGIGGQLARPTAPCLILTGDGCMRMHGMEIAVAARYNIPVIFLVANNAGYGSVRRRCPNAESRAALGSLPMINWHAFATSLGVAAIRVERRADWVPALESALQSRRPVVLDLVLPAGSSDATDFASIWPSADQC
jgi:acetolactate synthase-1/2/3 large subunit